MPEAAEVSVAAHQLGELASGHTLRSLRVTHPRTTRHTDPARVVALGGRRVDFVDRHGKWILVRLDGPDDLGIHLRMSGQLIVPAAGAVADRHVHAVLDFGDSLVWFRDPRTFGELRALDGPLDQAPDLFDPVVTARSLHEHARRRTVGVKAVLLDQRGALSGVGSYLADEACHRAGISPLRPANTLAVSAWGRILDAVRTIVAESASVGGTTLADEGWVDLYGRPGRFADAVAVHARETCRTCGAPTRSGVVGGRSARWCPRCQHPRRVR